MYNDDDWNSLNRNPSYKLAEFFKYLPKDDLEILGYYAYLKITHKFKVREFNKRLVDSQPYSPDDDL